MKKRKSALWSRFLVHPRARELDDALIAAALALGQLAELLWRGGQRLGPEKIMQIPMQFMIFLIKFY